MIEKINGRVIEKRLDKYIVQDIGKDEFTIIEAHIRGTVKKASSVLVGDIVALEKHYDKYMIESVCKRRNSLVRPPVANIDNIVVIVAISNPKPDYNLLDKQLILALSKNIELVLCINKVDLVVTPKVMKELEYIESTYGKLGIKIVKTSAVDSTGISELLNVLENKVSAFSGNSGVGKSSIMRRILNTTSIEVGNISKKTNKGKHTTKYVKLYETKKGTYILDTPGFSSYELYDISYRYVKDYYPEFSKCTCEYEDCTHIQEKEDVCDVKRQVSKCNIDIARYERYVDIFKKLKEKEDIKYK